MQKRKWLFTLLLMSICLGFSEPSFSQSEKLVQGGVLRMKDDHTLIARGIKNRFFINKFHLPAYRVCTFLIADRESKFFKVGRGSYFMLGESCFLVENLIRRNPTTKESGVIVFRRVTDIPKHAHIIHKTKIK